MTLMTLRTFLITFLLALVRLATEKEIRQVNHSPSFYLRVNYAESIYVSVTSHEIWTLMTVLVLGLPATRAKMVSYRQRPIPHPRHGLICQIPHLSGTENSQIRNQSRLLVKCSRYIRLGGDVEVSM